MQYHSANPKYSFADGRYTSKVFSRNSDKVYVDYEEDIHVYPLRKAASGYVVDTTNQKPLVFGEQKPEVVPVTLAFSQNSFDIYFLTIPFKYRFAQQELPRQFDASLNTAVYLGYRSDVYVLHYANNLLSRSKRSITHIGFSFGLFSRLGGTPINQWVTNDRVQLEYEGMVWSKGISGIIGLNHFTTGLAFGWDHLLEPNRKH